MAPGQLRALLNFYEARNRPTEPFYFYDPYETVPKFSWDGTGRAVEGRHVVRFEGLRNHKMGLAGVDARMELFELP